MANRNWASGGKVYSMHVKPVMMTATAQIGGTGAVTSFVGSAIQSFARTGTGTYLVIAQSRTNFSRLYTAIGTMQSPPAGLSGISTIEIQNAPNASVQTAAAMRLTIKCLDAAGALADPATGSAISLMAILSDSSVLIDGE